MNIPDDRKYAESHEWIQVEGSLGVVGISDHAQNELSDVVFVELPKIGKKFQAKEPSAVVESVKAASDIYAPVSGTITEVNNTLENDPSLINQDPYGQGWIYKIELSEPRELDSLKKAEEYQQQME